MACNQSKLTSNNSSGTPLENAEGRRAESVIIFWYRKVSLTSIAGRTKSQTRSVTDTRHDGPYIELIACAARLGGIGEMQAAIRRHLPVQVRAGL